MKKLISLLLCAALAAGILSGCGASEPIETTQAALPTIQAATEPPSPRRDTLSVTIPQGEQGLIPQWVQEFQRLYPHLTVEIKREPVEKYQRHLLVDVRDGQGPDLALVNGSELGRFVQMGVGVDLSLYLPPERLEDYDQGPLAHMSEDGVPYGLPVYAQVWGLGGNRELLEAAGVDIARIQQEGWEYPQFLEAVAAGSVVGKSPRERVYGFTYPNTPSTVERFIRSFGAGAGLCHDFTRECRYTMTSRNMLEFLRMVETMLESGNLMTEQLDWEKGLRLGVSGKLTMLGCVPPVAEERVRNNNALLAADSREAVQGSRNTEFVFLPAPSMPGCLETSCGTVVGFMAMRNGNSTEEHLANVALLVDYLSSGERAAQCVESLYLDPLCRSGREVRVPGENRNPDNLAAASRSAALIALPSHDVSRPLRDQADNIMETVIIPGFLQLRSVSMTAEKLYDRICQSAYETMGQENCVTGYLPVE